MYENIHIPIQNLRKPTKIHPGGLCRIYFARHTDVETWPVKDPVDGVIKSPIDIKVGASLYVVEATEKERAFIESTKTGPAGDFFEMQVTTHLPGNSVNTILGLDAMLNQDFVLIIKDRDGYQRLIGSPDKAAVCTNDFTSGDIGSSRYRKLVWKFSSALSAPVYEGGTVIIDNANYVFTALRLIDRFRVNYPTQPQHLMEGDVVYTNPLLANGNFIIMSGGKAIHQMTDKDDDRYAVKPYESSSIFIHGGVYAEEVIEIYKF